MKKIFSGLVVLFYSIGSACSAEQSIKFTINKSCVIYKELWAPFRYVVKFADGLRIPLAGDFSPLKEKSEGSTLNIENGRITVEASEYDLTEYRNREKEAHEKLKKSLGKDLPIAAPDGIPYEGEKTYFIVVTRIEANGKQFDTVGFLEKMGIKKLE
jgi:hypothetical protein